MTGTPPPLAAGARRWGRRIEAASAALGAPVHRDWATEPFAPARTGRGNCRLVACADGWVAVNLARPDDRDLVPAWLAVAGAPEHATLDRAVGPLEGRALVAAAELVGLPVGLLGERRPDAGGGVAVTGSVTAPARRRPPVVVDLSALWAGPLCGALLAAAGATVTKVEATTRPDRLRHGSPDLFARLNGAKHHRRVDVATTAGRARLAALVAEADVVVEASRPRALAQLGLAPDPARQVWVSITGHGRASGRVAFGDDAAVAGGLVAWAADRPRLLGRAAADPLSGLAAAAVALELLAEGRTGLVEVAMAGVAAGAAAGGWA